MLVAGGYVPRAREACANVVQIDGEDVLIVERLTAPLRRALGGRRAPYRVHVATAGSGGDVLVRIVGLKGCIPLRFAPDELEPGYVHGIVRDTVDRFRF